jgi:VIT1/CCC1 family predicted Fe2+/Mn2+ transporter
LLVAVSYLAGALVPVLPVLLGARGLAWSLAAGTLASVAVSALLAFLSGMELKRRLALNVAILAAAVAVTYAIGLLTRAVFGLAV